MRAFWQTALSELESGHKVFAAFVATCSKGSPGTPKARLLVRTDGTQLGTIGGGVMEKQLLAMASEALRDDSHFPRLQSISHRPKSASPSGLICGGQQSNALLVLRPESDLETARRIVQAIEQDAIGAITLSPRGLEYGSLLEPLSQLSLLEGDLINWTLHLSVFNLRRVAIFGAGHCGQALAQQMNRLGYRVSLTDSRVQLFHTPLLESGSVSIGKPAEQFAKVLKHWRRTVAIVMTHSYPTDLEALSALLPFEPAFVGLMGSPSKLDKIFAALRDQGFSETQIDTIKAPVGLPICSDTPEEIAVSIAAQILLEHNTPILHEH